MMPETQRPRRLPEHRPFNWPPFWPRRLIAASHSRSGLGFAAWFYVLGIVRIGPPESGWEFFHDPRALGSVRGRKCPPRPRQRPNLAEMRPPSPPRTTNGVGRPTFEFDSPHAPSSPGSPARFPSRWLPKATADPIFKIAGAAFELSRVRLLARSDLHAPGLRCGTRLISPLPAAQRWSVAPGPARIHRNGSKVHAEPSDVRVADRNPPPTVEAKHRGAASITVALNPGFDQRLRQGIAGNRGDRLVQ